MRARGDLRWLDVAYFQVNLDSQLKWYPLVTAQMLADQSREFWHGYAGYSILPDKLTSEQVMTILYILRLRCLLGGTKRPPILRSWADR
jgi:hypothetical protein